MLILENALGGGAFAIQVAALGKRGYVHIANLFDKRDYSHERSRPDGRHDNRSL
jgi:hypothetical protein